ncbi:DUF5994 family protein [Actinosynnema sp. NPDC023658]|uniref:DUF5994 family protein n=1 Tax=Actinosynnema sp. NPDC023658 TaxID=3155465 RepID=UPI0033D5C469
MKPPTAAPGSVDGGWWPRSNDPTTEFPPLITAMAALGRPVLRVSYDLDAWDVVGRRLPVGDAVVRMEGFRTSQPHTVTMIGPDRARTRLLVIPPATPGGAARAALRAAADPCSTATVADLLEWNNVAVRRVGATAHAGWRTVEHPQVDRGVLGPQAAARDPRREVRPYEDEIAS